MGFLGSVLGFYVNVQGLFGVYVEHSVGGRRIPDTSQAGNEGTRQPCIFFCTLDSLQCKGLQWKVMIWRVCPFLGGLDCLDKHFWAKLKLLGGVMLKEDVCGSFIFPLTNFPTKLRALPKFPMSSWVKSV